MEANPETQASQKDKSKIGLYASLGVLIGFSLILLAVSLFQGKHLLAEIAIVLLGAMVTVVITYSLLKSQTAEQEKLQRASEELILDREKNVEVYKEKLKVYAEFNRALWEVTDKTSFVKLRDGCMKELVMMLPYEKMSDFAKIISDLYADIDKESVLNKHKSKLTEILKNNIPEIRERSEGADMGSQAILQLANSFRVEENWENAEVESKQECKDEGTEMKLKSAELRNIWNAYVEGKGKMQCWHFAAWDNDIQNKALREQNKNVLSLMEYDEDWRTARLRQVKEGDVLFLFNRGGAGYVGMYRATGNCIIHNLGESGVTVELQRKGEAPKKIEDTGLSDDMRKYDIYEAYDDGATYVSSVIVEKIQELDGDTSSPINVIRQTIARLSNDNVEKLLEYFDGKETGNDN